MDQIRRKLELIDAQLAGAAGFHTKVISTSPLLFAAVGLVAGIFTESRLDLPVWVWMGVLVFCAAAAIVLFAAGKEGRPGTFAYLTVVCFVCLGAVRLDSFCRLRSDDISNFVGNESKLATIRGRVVTEPFVGEQQWEFADFRYTDPGSSFYLRLDAVTSEGGWAKVSGTVRVQVDEPVLDLKAGDYVKAYCWLSRFEQRTNPGQFNTAHYLALRNVFVGASVKSREGIELPGNSRRSLFARVQTKVRESASQALLGDIAPEDQSRGLLEALLLGQRGNIASDTNEAFRKTGLSHFISLSGLHLGILIVVVWWICRAAGLMQRARAIISIIVLCLFLLVVPPRGPTLRAAVICFVFCLSFFFRRRPNSLNTLSLAAIILLLIRPTQLFEAGWQLSFVSVLGLVLFCRRIHFFLYEKIAGLPWHIRGPKTRPFFRIISRPGPYLLELFSTSLTAWLSSAGILLYHFFTITPLTVVWTVIVFPLIAGILAGGFLKIIIAFVLPTPAAAIGVVVARATDLLILIVKYIASLNILEIRIGAVPAEIIVCYYGLILFAFFARFKRPLVKWMVCLFTGSVIIVFLGVTKWQRTYGDNLVLTCLDVGHGQAIVAQLPGGNNILLDAGSGNKADVGRRIVAPFLDYRGISNIDAIIISHGDFDHINGIPGVIGHCRVNEVYAGSSFLGDADRQGPAEFLKDLLRQKDKDRKINQLDSGSPSHWGAEVTVLWPSRQVSKNGRVGANDKSLVILIEFAGRKVLLCSDIEKFAQRELLRLYPALAADVVVVPHHGSVNTLDAAFLEKLGPCVLICSCSVMQYAGKSVVKSANGAEVFYTASEGAVIVSVDNKGTITTATANTGRRPGAR